MLNIGDSEFQDWVTLLATFYLIHKIDCLILNVNGIEIGFRKPYVAFLNDFL